MRSLETRSRSGELAPESGREFANELADLQSKVDRAHSQLDRHDKTHSQLNRELEELRTYGPVLAYRILGPVICLTNSGLPFDPKSLELLKN